LVFLLFKGTSGIDQPASGAQVPKGIRKDTSLYFSELSDVLRFESPFDFGISAERAGAGTGGVNEDPVERPGERQRLGSVENDSTASFDAGESLQVEVAGDRIDAEFESVSGLVARGGAEVKKGMPGL
jgi:hypothetical protein